MERRKQRSPKYPIFGLKTAIEKLEAFFQKETHSSVPRDVAVMAWGYKGLSGVSLQTLSTLIQYGLLDNVGSKNVKISDLGMSILHSQSNQEQEKSLQAAARNPSIYQELMKKFGETRPSEENIRAYLLRRSPIPYNVNAAKTLISSYKETLEFANPQNARYNNEDEEDINSKTNRFEANDMIESMSIPAQQKPKNAVVWTFPISQGMVSLSLPTNETTKEDIDFIKMALDVFKKTLPSKQ